jgi:hypothetical protein
VLEDRGQKSAERRALEENHEEAKAHSELYRE